MRNFNSRIALLVSAVLFTALFIITIFDFSKQKSLISYMEQDKYKTLEGTVNQAMSAHLEKARSSALSVANNPEVAKLFAAGDRQGLTKMLKPVFDKLKGDGLEQMQFHLPPATSFLRLHAVDKFGDDLSSFRFTVIEANKNKRIVEGLEEGKGGWGFRVVVPISYDGAHIGTVESGMEFDKKFLTENLKKRTGADFFIYQVGNNSVAWEQSKNKYLAATMDQDTYSVSDQIVNKVVTSSISSYEYSSDKTKALLVMPIKDYAGQTKGYIKAIIDRTEIINKLNSNLIQTVVRSLTILVLALISIFLIINHSLLKPLKNLTDKMNKVVHGDLTVNIANEHLIKCWEVKKCNKKVCIAYNSDNLRCWQLTGTHCGNLVQGDLVSKQKNCDECIIYQHATKSEISKVSEIFNSLVVAQKNLIGQIQGTARTLSVASQELSATVNDQTAIVQHNISTLDNATNLIENNVSSFKAITANLDDVNKGADSVAEITMKVVENTDKAKKQADAGNSSALETDKAISGVVNISNEINANAIELEKSSQQIGEILNVITGIAEQTNLLALNAAIEAARAGDAGKGFAVVAEEVRKLAEQSSISTKEISDIIADIQQKTKKTVSMIKDSKDAISVGKDRTVESAETIRKIAQTIVEISEEMQDIASTSQEQAALTNQVNNIIHSTDKKLEEAAEKLSTANSKMKDQAHMFEEINGTVEELTSMAEELLNYAAKFKVN